MPVAGQLIPLDLHSLAVGDVVAVAVHRQTLADAGEGLVIAQFHVHAVEVQTQAHFTRTGDDRLQLQQAFHLQPRFVQPAQHTADVRHAEAFGIAAVELRPIGGLVGEAVVAQGFAERHLAAGDAHPTGVVGAPHRAEVIHVELGMFAAHAGHQGQLVGQVQVALEEACLVVVGRRWHVATIGLHQHLLALVAHQVEAAGQIQQTVEQAFAAQGQLATPFLRVTAALLPQGADRRDVGVLEGR